MLSTIIVNKHRTELESLKEMFKLNPYVDVVGIFEDCEEAVTYAMNNAVDFVVIDIDIPELDYLKIGKRLRIIKPNIIIFFITSDGDVEHENSLRKVSDGVIVKPVTQRDVHDFILRAEFKREKIGSRAFTVRTFGQFDVYHNGEYVYFPNAKAKELFALCIDHLGGQVCMEEAIDKLWPDKPYDERAKRLYRKAVSCVKSTLIKYSMTEVFKSTRGSCCAVLENIRCDYFNFVAAVKDGEADPKLVESYMPEYSWAEYTIAKIYFSENSKD